MSFFRNLACTSVFLMLATSVFAAGNSSDPKRMYSWVDADGVTHYSDSLPPEAADRKRAELDRQGRTRKTVDPNAPLKEEAKTAQIVITPEDRALLSSYLSIHDIDIRRDEALATIDKQIESDQRMRKQRAERKDALLKEQAAGKTTPMGELEILNYEIALSDTSLRLRQVERSKITAKFQKDKERWLYLKQKDAETAQASAAPKP